MDISLLSDWKIYSFIGFGDTIWDQEDTLVKLSNGKATGAHSTAALEQCVSNVNTKSRVDTKSRLRNQSRFCIK